MSETEIVLGSALDTTPELAAGCVLITDPPFSDHVHAGVRRVDRATRRDLGFSALTPELRAHIAAIGARCRWSVVFSDWEGLSAWREAFDAQPGYRYIRAIPWIRWSMPQLSGDRPPQGSEAIILAAPVGKLRWNGPGNLTHFDELCERGKDKHTTAKPLDLMLRLVSYFSDPGETVIDPCAGRGTTILAARLLERSGFGVEINPTEAELARARVAGPLAPRDAERANRYDIFRTKEVSEFERMRAVTAAVRLRKDSSGK
jgi:hypothetical protein